MADINDNALSLQLEIPNDILLALFEGERPGFRVTLSLPVPANQNPIMALALPKPFQPDLVLYDAGCPGQKSLAETLKLRLFKKGFSTLPPSVRMDRLNKRQYAAYVRNSENPAIFDGPIDGFAEWSLSPNFERDFTGMPIPDGVRIKNNVIEISLPQDVSPDTFDNSLRQWMQPRELNFWLSSPLGVAHCQKHQIDHGESKRLAQRYSWSVEKQRHEAVEEIYVYSPRFDRSWFMSCLAGALKSVMGRTGH